MLRETAPGPSSPASGYRRIIPESGNPELIGQTPVSGLPTTLSGVPWVASIFAERRRTRREEQHFSRTFRVKLSSLRSVHVRFAAKPLLVRGSWIENPRSVETLPLECHRRLIWQMRYNPLRRRDDVSCARA